MIEKLDITALGVALPEILLMSEEEEYFMDP